MITSGRNKKDSCTSKSIPLEQGDLTPQLVKFDGLNLPTLFGEVEDHTNYEFDSNDFKYSDLFDENSEVYADTLWSSVDHGDMTARDEHGCLMSIFDVYTVSTLSSPFELLTIMSTPPPQHRGARPKTRTSAPRVKYACVACAFEDFKTAHSLRRHMIRVQTLPVTLLSRDDHSHMSVMRCVDPMSGSCTTSQGQYSRRLGSV